VNPQDEGAGLLWVFAFLCLCAVGTRIWLVWSDWRRMRALRAEADEIMGIKRGGRP
jgi:hypothetical protein